MSEKIVVGSDGSDTAKQAVDEAMRIAKAVGAELHVVMSNHSLRGAHIVGAPQGAVPVYGSMHDGVPAAVIDEAVAAARIFGVTAEGHVIDRDPADALLEVANQVGASTIVVGNKGMSGGRRLLGSVPNKVSHEARCNVLIVATT
ncbi:MAG TPA: universal stress protein [Solirubrobacteraceae bacterium]|jgi:nucleotide-binding universal stress UspA family protein